MKIWSIRKRSLFIFALGALFLMFSLVLVIFLFLKEELRSLENTVVDRNINRVQNTYNFVRGLYEKKIVDWGEWDDTYKFVKDLNKEYITSNLGESTLSNLNVDEVLFFDNDGRVVYSKASEATLQIEPDFPEDVRDIFIDNKDILEKIKLNKLVSGLLKTEDGVLLFSAHLITRSDGSGEPRGVILFGRYVDKWLTDDMSEISQIKVTLSKSERYEITPEIIYKSFSVPVENGSDVLHFTAQTKREIWSNAQMSFYILALVTITVSILTMAANYYFLHTYILSDIQNFKKEINEIIVNSGKGYIKNDGKTEDLVGLRNDFNNLLKKLEELKMIKEQKINELNNLNNLMIGRELVMKDLKEKLNDLKKKII